MSVSLLNSLSLMEEQWLREKTQEHDKVESSRISHVVSDHTTFVKRLCGLRPDVASAFQSIANGSFCSSKHYSSILGQYRSPISLYSAMQRSEGGNSLYQIMSFGSSFEGHATMVHGGAIAVILDEAFARLTFSALPNNVGVTASLNLNFLRPCPVNTVVLLKAWVTHVEGRKVCAKAQLFLMEEIIRKEDPIVVAETTFVEPDTWTEAQKITNAKLWGFEDSEPVL